MTVSNPTATKNSAATRSLVLSAVGAIFGLVLAGYTLFTAKGTSGGGLPPEDVALVNQRPILQSDFVTQTQLETGAAFKDASQADRRKVLGEMIDEELLVQRGLDVDLAASDPDVRSALVAGVNLQVDADILAAPPEEAALRRYFAEHHDRYAIDGSMDLRDWVMPAAARDAAQAAVAALRANTPLDEIVKRFDLHESGKLGHGDNYDFGVKAKLGDALYTVAAKLGDGQVADPVADGSVLHVIYMVKRKPIIERDFEAARDTVWQDYQRDARTRVEQANLAFLKSKADIVIAPELSAAEGSAP